MDGAALRDACAGLAFPYPLRRHQGEALAALEDAWAGGRRRAWVVLPPGAGKTLVGLETIRRAGRRAVVLSPSSAIQGQWVRGWGELVAADGSRTVEVGTDRDLQTPVTVLNYQSLAVFGDPEDDPQDDPEDGPVGELERLHPRGRALVEAMRSAGPLTLVLDECHHLLEVWGRLLVEVLALLPDATVLGLTATPPATLTRDQAALVDELFGPVAYAASIPAVVREGHLAPFADLVWLTSPSAAEAQWLGEQALRFAELTTQLLDPGFGSVPFLEWVDRRFAGERALSRVARRSPELADAALRLAHAGLVRLPDDVPVGEAHRRDPTTDDWARLIDDWHDGCLAGSTDERDEQVLAALRRALPAVGHQLTRAGVRRGRSSIDRVLARSESKSRAMVEIVAAEHRVLGDRLAMVVICDHESASATLSADLRGVLDERNGSARLALASLLADPATRPLCPVLVTGRTVAGAPEAMRRLAGRVAAEGGPELVVGPADADGIAELVGAWSSRQWVPAVTELFTDGECRVLVGTRALLGEGWDAPRASGLVDLSMASTPGTVVQTRGRTLRLDPADPDKVAINWTVCCVAEGRPRGDNDWQRTVAKHRGYFGVDATGDVVDGVAHIHPALSPHAPPPEDVFDAVNAAMLVRAEQRREIAGAWRVGEPYVDEERWGVWLRPVSGGASARRPDTEPSEPSGAAPAPPDVLLGPDGLRGRWPHTWLGAPVALLAGAVSLLALVLVVLVPALGAAVLALVPGALLPGAVAAREVGVRRRAVLESARREPDLVQVAWALADGLSAAGLTSRGAGAVQWHVAADGALRFRLETPDPEESAVFADALAELVAPIRAPRYLVPRYVAAAPTTRDLLSPLAAHRPSGVVWHPVPTVLAVRAELAQAFAGAWQQWVGGGPAVYTGGPEGAGALAASRGTNPLEAGSVLRLGWG